MQGTDDELTRLLTKYAADQANTDEINRMLNLLSGNPDNPALLNLILQWKNDSREDAPDLVDWEKLWQTISRQTEEKRTVKFSLRKKLAIAASILLLTFTTWYLVSHNQNKPATLAEKGKGTDMPAPSSSRARLSLQNGQNIYLDSISNGEIADQGTTRLLKLANGELAAQLNDPSAINAAGYNILHNPNGSEVAAITLSDGSKVWLNAGSSLRFPVAFAQHERKVFVDGEAFFEIAPNNAKPFRVAKNDLEIQVLGTRFNMRAYDDETRPAITLLQGAVKVRNGTGSRILKPGQSALVNGKIELNEEADINKTMAWKEGWFDFGNNTDIEIIMQEIARWYDVDVVYSDKITQGFGGAISRKASIRQVLEKFELTGRVHFRIEGRKIIVSK